MKFLFFSDLHSHSFEQFASILPNGRNSRLEDILNVVEQVRQTCIDNEVDYLFMLGDVFHSRTKIDIDVHSATFLAFKRCSEVVKHFYILVGNHDQHGKVGNIHSLESFRSFATVVDLPTVFRVGDDIESRCIAMHPFTTDIYAWKAFVKYLCPVDIFCFHQGVSEASIGAFDVYIKAEVDVNDIPWHQAELNLAGHYHKHQKIEGGFGQGFYYIGSPIQLNFGERNEEKGFLLVDTKTWEIKQIPSKAPRFYMCTLEEYKQSILDCKFNILKDFIRITGCKASDVEEIKKFHPRAQVEVKELSKESVARVDSSIVSSDKTLLGAYVSGTKTSLEQERLLSLGLELVSGNIE